MVELISRDAESFTQELAVDHSLPTGLTALEQAKFNEHVLFERFMCWWNKRCRKDQLLIGPERYFALFRQHVLEVFGILPTAELRPTFSAIEEAKFCSLQQELDSFIHQTTTEN